MRIDLALKYLCLAKSRSGVKTLCDKSAITVNSQAAKASTTVRVGDRISVVYPASGERPARTLTIELTDIPARQASKAKAPSYYDVIEDYTA